jgi:hypothetical protein
MTITLCLCEEGTYWTLRNCHYAESAASRCNRFHYQHQATMGSRHHPTNATHSRAINRSGQPVSTRRCQAPSIGHEGLILHLPRLAGADAERPSPSPAAGPVTFPARSPLRTYDPIGKKRHRCTLPIWCKARFVRSNVVVSCRTQCTGWASTQACFTGLHVARRCWPRFRSKE